MNRPMIALILLYGVAVAQLAWLGPQLPERVATHYDAAGNPNGWMTRDGTIAFHLGMLGVTALAFAAAPMLLGRLSPALINIPNREYWLAPERVEGTVDTLRRWMLALGCGAVLLMMAIAQLNFRANLEPMPRLSGTGLLACVAGFLVYLTGWIVALYRRFPKPHRT
jgi:hypothetical protein